MKREFPQVIELPKDIKVARVLVVTGNSFEVSVDSILSKNKQKNIADARHVAISLLSFGGLSNLEISDLFKGSPSLSVAARKATRNKYEGDAFFAAKFNATLAILNKKNLKIDIKKAKQLVSTTKIVKNQNLPAVYFLSGYNYALQRLKLS